ncbi:fibulin-2-like [Gadus chalcogrammus]|uniref:fibulin-2-like n=1 Tax=Gadus chalcogrammus TaxID=1042646 RepID=UPI0024C25A88|nr:fibulin-2-like [Gadus chalcogrammus]XP_056449059.1 fibulin-2-like [Gadus chalcogrammus]
MDIQRVALCLSYVILYLDISLSQKDCTSVDCPVLQNCIEEVLEVGACCATCVHKGCTCEGYQYYDCVNAGFRKGKVPQGESYFVDFGSTECSCPRGGGRISCQFIPCPDLPSNCIDIRQPADGCPQCGRIGCVHGNDKYKAGHRFHMDPCQMCYCPNDGGHLVCSPVPGCNPHGSKKTMLTPPTENNEPLRGVSHLPDNTQTRPREPFSKLPLGDTLPLYKQDPPAFGTDEHDYTLAEPTSSLPLERDQILKSIASPLAHPEASFVSSTSRDDRRREEPGETPGSLDQERNYQLKVRHQLLRQYTEQPAAGARSETITSAGMAPTTPSGTTESPTPQQEAPGRTARRQDGDQERVAPNTSKDTPAFSAASGKEGRLGGHHRHRQLNSSRRVASLAQGHEGPTEAVGGEQRPYPTVQWSPTRRAPVRRREEGDKPRRQAQTLLNYHSQTAEGETDVSAAELLRVCCETGEKWATANGHCLAMELPREERHSICRTAQKQCCLGALRQQRCLAGLTAATSGAVCEDSDECGGDAYTECCGCCSLGLRLLSEGQRCEAPPYLGPRCRQSLLACCRAEAGAQGGGADGGWRPIRERPLLDPTPLPNKVSDSPFPKEAFSIGEEEEEEEEEQRQGVPDEENTAEGPFQVEHPFQVEDMDECAVYQDSLCPQRCVNTPGSFRCECFAGFLLQQDNTCKPEREENGLEEHHKATAGGVEEPTTTPPPPPPPSTPTQALLNPCEGHNPCAQQCRPVGGRVQCSCGRGFSLRADGYSCEDVNECLVQSHTCGLGFDCVNTEGSFRCTARTQCSAGFGQDAQGNCIDIDECMGLSQPCSPGFTCLNTVGSYTCQRKMLICSRGYHASPDGASCIDVDECQNNLHRCGDGQLCNNLPGSYRCDCQPGYQYDSYRRTCVDVNECWRYPGRLCAQTCDNTPGSYQCSCTTGFHLAADGKNCEDVNECLANPCGQECANMYGSYQCYCNRGYHLREDGHTCEDFDECAQSVGHLCTYKCVNVPGSYQCACPEHGYSMAPNGRSCRDIDECAIGAHNCSLEQTCYNIQGGHRCLDLSCPPNYRKAADTRCERTGCPNHQDCQTTPLRITYYYLSFQSNILVPAQIFRIGPSPAYTGDNVIVAITRGNDENYFSTRKLSAYTGAVYLQRQAPSPQDFLIEVEMKLWRQGTFTTFQARIYVFITGNPL